MVMCILHFFKQKAKQQEEETSPIEFFRITHTNKDNIMSAKAKSAYVRNISY
jgi:hypothetical protein